MTGAYGLSIGVWLKPLAAWRGNVLNSYSFRLDKKSPDALFEIYLTGGSLVWKVGKDAMEEQCWHVYFMPDYKDRGDGVGVAVPETEAVWYHILTTWEIDVEAGETRMKIYQNGTLISSCTSTTLGSKPVSNMTENFGFFAGGSDGAGGYNYAGFIDDIRMWNRALNDSEARVIGNETLTHELEAHAPVISAGLPQTIHLEASGTVASVLQGEVQVQSSSISYSVQWGFEGAQNETAVRIHDRSSLHTAVNFSATGYYMFSLTVLDCYGHTVKSFIRVAVFDQLPAADNQPPFLWFYGSNRINNMPSTFDKLTEDAGQPVVSSHSKRVLLEVTVEDDGLPHGGDLKATWRRLSGPGDLQFTNCTTDLSGQHRGITVEASEVGIYALQVRVSDGEKESTTNFTLNIREKRALGFWPFEHYDVLDPACTIEIKDLSGNNHSGLLQWSNNKCLSYPNWWPGVFGGAIGFTGNGQDRDNDQKHRELVDWFTFANEDTFTLSLWMKPTYETNEDRERDFGVIEKIDITNETSGCYGGWRLTIGNLPLEQRNGYDNPEDTIMKFDFFSGRWDKYDNFQNPCVFQGTVRPAIHVTRKITKHVWNHVVISFEKGGLHIYVNGTRVVNVGGIDIGAFANSRDRMRISALTPYNYVGGLDDMVIFNYALSAAEAKELGNVGAASYIATMNRGQIDDFYGQITPFGYSREEMLTHFSRLGTSDPETGLNEFEAHWSNDANYRLPPGVHPRVHFSPTELPDVRQRATNLSERARALTGSVRAELHVGPGFTEYAFIINDGCFLALLDADGELGRYWSQKLTILIEEMYSQLVELREYYLNVPWISIFGTSRNWRQLSDVIAGNPNLAGHHRQWAGTAYDHCYNFMNSTERDIVRSYLSMLTDKQESIGMYNAGAALQSSTSNWIPMVTYDLGILSLSIEGEPGSDIRVAQEVKNTAERYNSVGVNPSGAPYEGEGKFGLGAFILPTFLKRWNRDKDAGVRLMEQSVYRYQAHYLLHRMVPWGGNAFGEDEALGTSSNPMASTMDLAIAKHLFPDDERLEIFYRLVADVARCPDIGESGDHSMDCWNRAPAIDGHGQTWSDVYAEIAIASDPYGGYSSESWDEAWEMAENAVGHSLICCERGIMITRSRWRPDAQQLTYQPRSLVGGHSSYDRGYFLLNALGRVWINYPGQGESSKHSVLHVNGVGPDVLPAQFLNFFDSSTVTFSTANLSMPYRLTGWAAGVTEIQTYEYTVREGQGSMCSNHINGIPEENWIPDAPVSDRRLKVWSDGWKDLPHTQETHWDLGIKRGGSYLGIRIGMPLTEYHRSAALVRGAGSEGYSVIVDDMQSDGASHSLKWQISVESDLHDVIEYKGNNVVLTDPSTGNQLHAFPFVLNSIPSMSSSQEDFCGSVKAAEDGYGPSPFAVQEKLWWSSSTVLGFETAVPENRTKSTIVVVLLPVTSHEEPPTVAFRQYRQGATIELSWDNGSTVDHLWFSDEGSDSTLTAITRGSATKKDVIYLADQATAPSNGVFCDWQGHPKWNSPLFDVPACNETRAFREMVNVEDYNAGIVVTGGLGNLIHPGVFEVWVCVKQHSCIGAVDEASYFAAQAQDLMCFVHNELSKQFEAWGYNSVLQLVGTKT